jgi:hypothetical protein
LIPPQYLGRWSGDVSDVNRRTKYTCDIVVDVDRVHTTYDFQQLGPTRGRLTELCAEDGFLVWKEILPGPSGPRFTGTLMLYLDVDGNLRCVWRDRRGFNSEAIMRRCESADPPLD